MIDFPQADDKDCLELLEESEPFLESLSNEMKIDCVHPNYFKEIVIPLTLYLRNLPDREEPYFIGLNGGQGSGKTTLSDFIQAVLSRVSRKSVTGFSIDDIYKTTEEREKQSIEIHPLCKVRGVPGTHDVQMGLEVLDRLCGANEETLTPIPSFSKPLDRHKPKEEWKVFKGRPDYIFFDAWCAGARPISERNWKPPLNALEKEEDPEGVWSKWSNKELSGDYQDLFRRFDLLLMIKVPGIEYVYESRWLQEQTLAKTIVDPELKDKIMTKEEVYRFVMHYERLTHYILEEMPAFSDIVLQRDEEFNFSIIKTP
jgi:D-glycerate 3-kinase